MSAVLQFHSSLAPALVDFVAWKQCQGYDYTDRAVRLARFDRFLCARQYPQPILTPDMAAQYIDSLSGLTPLGRYGDVSAVRTFSRYLNVHRTESHVLPAGTQRLRYRPRFYLYSPQELSRLLHAARRLPAHGFVPPATFHLLVGLLYTTGLRISEALALDLTDLHVSQTRLLVRRGKFGKDRWIALHPSSVRRLRAYLRGRSPQPPAGQPLFQTRRGTRLSRDAAESAFRRLVQGCGIDSRPAGGPRLHDLRHTYACDCLWLWQQQGADLNALLPVLSTALGHVDLRATQIYLHTTAAQLQQAGERFRTFARPPIGRATS